MTPDALREFCAKNGANTIFDNLLRGMTDSRHSERRSKFNENKVVEIIYKMCYGRNQQCNFFQKAHGFFLKMNHVSFDGTYTSLKFQHIL